MTLVPGLDELLWLLSVLVFGGLEISHLVSSSFQVSVVAACNCRPEIFQTLDSGGELR